MVLAGSLSLYGVMVSGATFWAGKHLLSATKKNGGLKAENDMFRHWWKLPETRFARNTMRKAFK
jgi:hypothetical protein